MAPIVRFIISSGSKKEPRYACLSEAKPHTHTECGLRFPPPHHTSYKWGCSSTPLHTDVLLRMLCPVRRPVTALDFVLIKDSNRAADRNQFSSLSLSTTRTTPHYQMLVIHLACNLIFDNLMFFWPCIIV